MESLFDTLQERGYVYQSNDLDRIKKVIDGEPITFYLGIDPTADSLHIGHFLALMMFRYLQDYGHKGIILVGGATSLVGDPSMKSDIRKMLAKEQVNNNIEGLKKILGNFIKLDGENPAIIVNNADWICGYDYIDFMRDIGVHFNVNRMLAAEAYSNRLKQGGLTFLEMGYMLMQSYDFVHLNKEYGCKLQIGGSDQLGNMLAGVTLNRKMNNASEDTEIDEDIFVLTCPLLLNKDGEKMGKTAKGALWVAKDKTSAFDFYQYFYNLDDSEISKLLKLFTKIDLEEIDRLLNTDILLAKKTMAYEITKLVHGEEEANKVIDAISSLYSNNVNLENVPSESIDKSRLTEGVPLLDLIAEIKLVPTKSEGRRNVEQGGISLNGEKVTDTKYIVTEKDIDEETNVILFKKGKKSFLKVEFN